MKYKYVNYLSNIKKGHVKNQKNKQYIDKIYVFQVYNKQKRKYEKLKQYICIHNIKKYKKLSNNR